MGDVDAWLQIGLCQLFGFGKAQDADAALLSFEKILAAGVSASSPRSKEDALYWMAVLRLIRGPRTKAALAQARSWLSAANTDDDHEQANELLNSIGRN